MSKPANNPNVSPQSSEVHAEQHVATEAAPGSGEDYPPMKTSGNGSGALISDSDNVTSLQHAANTARSRLGKEEQTTLDEYEVQVNDAFLDEDEGDALGDKDEESQPLIVKKLPKFTIFRTSPNTFDLWGTSDQQGVDDLLYTTTKSFAPNFEEDVELRRVRFYETVDTSGVVRLVWCFVPEKRKRKAADWLNSKLDAMEHAQSLWTTMRSRMKIKQYSYRPSRKQAEYGEPKFSGRTREQWLDELEKQGIHVVSKDHEFYRKATDAE